MIFHNYNNMTNYLLGEVQFYIYGIRHNTFFLKGGGEMQYINYYVGLMSYKHILTVIGTYTRTTHLYYGCRGYSSSI